MQKIAIFDRFMHFFCFFIDHFIGYVGIDVEREMYHV